MILLADFISLWAFEFNNLVCRIVEYRRQITNGSATECRSQSPALSENKMTQQANFSTEQWDKPMMRFAFFPE